MSDVLYDGVKAKGQRKTDEYGLEYVVIEIFTPVLSSHHYGKDDPDISECANSRLKSEVCALIDDLTIIQRML